MSRPRTLPTARSAYRLGDPAGEYPFYSGEGAALYPGRWNAAGEALIYASEHYSTAMLEKLAHHSGELPPNKHFLEITLPAGMTYEVVTKDRLPGWHNKNARISKAFGSAWFQEGRSALLFVPSLVAREELNILINPHHPDAKLIELGLETPIWWDARLFRAG